MSHPYPKRSFVPQAVLTRSGKLSTVSAADNTVRPVNTANTKAVNTVRPVNTAASKQTMNHPRPINNTFKRGYSQISRPFNRYFANKNCITQNKNVNSVRQTHNKKDEHNEYVGNSKSGRDTRYLSLVVPLRKVGDEVVHKELGDRMERAATTASSSEAEQDSVVPGAKIPYEDVDAQNSGLRPAFERPMDSTSLKINAARHQLLLLVQVPAAEVNLIIYTSCIQQFWATAQVKMVNGVRQLQALIDKKKVIITEASIRNDLHLDDTEAIEIASLKKRVDKLEKRRQLRTTGLTRFKKLGTARRVKSSNAGLGAQEDASNKQGEMLDDDEVFMDVASNEKNELSTKLDDSTTGEAVTTVSVEDSAALTIQVSTANIGEVTVAKIDELTLAQTLIEIKAAKPKVVTTAALNFQ
ncbi:hypothetical protein Tco_0139097 [Tanacetum coccineum]